MANIESVELAQLNFAEVAAPGTPSAASVVVYAKSDGKLYAKDDAGNEYDLTSAGSGTSITVVHRTADSSVSSTSFADVANMGFSVAASTNYIFRYVVFFNTNATTVGIKLAVNGPASPTLLKVGGWQATGAGGANDSTIAQGSTTAYDSNILTATSGPGATNAVAVIDGIFKNGSTAGTLILRHASETATATTIEAGTFGTIHSF